MINNGGNRVIAEIIAIGSELITGSTTNTNAQYLSRKLLELGIEVKYHTAIEDDFNLLIDVFNLALNRADLIITTGGLGPTEDDLTKEAISTALGLELKLDLNMKQHIQNIFCNTKRRMTENNLKQALKPAGAEFLENSIGTAPGIFIQQDKKKIILLPGPPREVRLMFENQVVPQLRNDYNILTRSVNLVGIGESQVETRLMELDLDPINTRFATFARDGTIEISIIGKSHNKPELVKEINGIIEKIEEAFQDYIYGYDNISLEEAIVELLKSRDLTIGLAESCTGGLISSKLTTIPGASVILERGIVSYSNQSKIEELKVKKSTLKTYGAVSNKTAYEMAKGLLNKTNIDIALSVTGIAGPGGGSAEKPVGTVFVCVMSNKDYMVEEYRLNGNRIMIQNRTTTRALNLLRKFILDNRY